MFGVAAGVTPPEAALDLAAGFALLAAGAVSWARVPRSGTGPLLALAAAAWLAGDASSALAYAHRGPLVHALLTYPTGRTRSPLTIAIIAAAYVDGLIAELARAPWATLVLVVAVVGVAAWRRAGTRGIERRVLNVPVFAAAGLGGPLALAAVGELTGSATEAVAASAFAGATAVAAAALAVGLVSDRAVRSAATGLIVDLADHQAPRRLRAVLAQAVGDPALQIAFRFGEQWLDEAGQPVRLPDADRDARVVTIVEDRGTQVAAILHDPAALRDPVLERSVLSAVRLTVANVRLQAEIADRVRDVAASRRRLVEAGDEQRRRLREQLRGGAEQDLGTVSQQLAALARERDGPTAVALLALLGDLDGARTDLARFAQGVHPRALTQHGLHAALRQLSDQAAVAVTLEAPERRFPALQEAAAYFVCAEGLANVAKYADACDARIEVACIDTRLLVRVVDDGPGGADATRGSGLRGLADRVEALGGTLAVTSPLGTGTVLEAELPIGQGPQS